MERPGFHGHLCLSDFQVVSGKAKRLFKCIWYLYTKGLFNITTYLSIHPPIHPSIHPSIQLSIYQSIHPSIYPSTCLRIYLSIHRINWVRQNHIMLFVDLTPCRILNASTSRFTDTVAVKIAIQQIHAPHTHTQHTYFNTCHVIYNTLPVCMSSWESNEHQPKTSQT